MKKIILFDPSYSTFNLGDFIINEAVMEHMHFLFSKHFLIRHSTHTPLAHIFQMPFKYRDIIRTASPDTLKFLGGSNILKLHLLRPLPDWNINLVTQRMYRNSVCIGAGLEGNYGTEDIISRIILPSVLSKDYVHSVRDATTEKYLKEKGFKVIDTGCPTLWNLTPKHCEKIPHNKQDQVVFTLTSYKSNRDIDQEMINILIDNYDKVHFWPQDVNDYEYFSLLENIDNIHIVSPNLIAYKRLLENGNIDYIGTRLHAGIYAMQHSVRSIIQIVDNRARDMQKSYNLNAIERDDIQKLEFMINSEFSTNILIDERKINEWKSQFVDY